MHLKYSSLPDRHIFCSNLHYLYIQISLLFGTWFSGDCLMIKSRVELCLLVALLCCATPTSQAIPTVFSVTNNNDTGAGSFRQAILDANASAGADKSIVWSGTGGTISL